MDNEKLKKTWYQLWRFAITLGLPPDDAKDIVQNALINTLKTYNPGQGEFLHLARAAGDAGHRTLVYRTRSALVRSL